MKKHLTHRPVALAALIAATALPFGPVFAQETVTPPAIALPAPAPAAPPAATPATPERVFAPRQEVVQPVPPAPTPPPETAINEPQTTAAERPARAAERPRRAAPRPAPAVERAAPTPAPIASAPVVAEPVTPLPPEPVAVTPEPTPEVAPVDPTETPVEATAVAPWMLIVGGLAILAALLGFLFARRRRSVDTAYADETAEPAAAAVDLDERPWIRLALQPTGTTSSGDQQTVDYELIVENEGRVPAHDVRVSSFLTSTKPSASDSLATPQTHNISLEPGASVPLPGKVTVREGVDPKIVADARYPLPNGGQGHLAALFGIDMSADEPAAQVEDVLERV